ncbi:hypothetical protein [Sphingomonas hankookensis]
MIIGRPLPVSLPDRIAAKNVSDRKQYVRSDQRYQNRLNADDTARGRRVANKRRSEETSEQCADDANLYSKQATVPDLLGCGKLRTSKWRRTGCGRARSSSAWRFDRQEIYSIQTG